MGSLPGPAASRSPGAVAVNSRTARSRPQPLVRGIVHGLREHRRRTRLAEEVDAERRDRRGEAGFHVGEAQAPTRVVVPSARDRDPDRPPVLDHRLPAVQVVIPGLDLDAR